MRINLNQLSVFYLASRHRSMAAAARALFVSPSAVTMQIKKMEGWLGFPVFERGQGELKLTERGQGLYEALQPMFGNLDELEHYIKDLMHAEEAELRFGTHHLPGNYFISDLISHVHTRFPDLRVRMELGTQDHLLEKLFQQKLDIVLIIGDPPDDPKCRSLHLFDEEMVLVTSNSSDFAGIPSISVKDLSSLPLILQQRGTGALREVLHFLRVNKVEPHILFDNLSSDVIKQFLQRMPAASFINRFIVQKELNEEVFHEIRIREGQPICRFHLVYLANQYPPLKMKHFLAGVPGFSPRFQTLGTGAASEPPKMV